MFSSSLYPVFTVLAQLARDYKYNATIGFQ
jgi:hypothetical protein